MAYKQLRHSPNCPYSGNFPVIEYNDLENLKKSNTNLETKLEQAKQAPELKRNVFKELKHSETRVAELEKMLEESYFEDKHNEAMKYQLQNTTMKIAKLTDELDEVNRKNNFLDERVNEKKAMEEKLSRAVANIGNMNKHLKAAQERSQTLERNLREAQARDGDLITAKTKLQNMERELNGAIRKLARVKTDLEYANDKFEHVPQELTRVNVNPGTSGRVIRSCYDGYGKKIKGTEKVISIADNRSVNENARSLDYRLGRVDKLKLERRLAQLKREWARQENQRTRIGSENQRLADEHRMLKQAFEKMEQIRSRGKKTYTVQDNRRLVNA